MKKAMSFFVVMVAMMLSCSQAPKVDENGQVVVEQIQEKGEEAKVTAKLSIEGMTCAHGCGGKIQQELQKLNGVKSTELDFIDGRPVNVVSVIFDEKNIDEKKMMGCVNTIADGKYKVVGAQRITTTVQ
jgi:Cu+-exporting ATPase